MEKETGNRNRLQWHSAFFAGIQIELEEDSSKLIFENEHQLTTKPLGIDVLVIKKRSDEVINKNIGKIFRGHNIIEYYLLSFVWYVSNAGNCNIGAF